MHDQNNRTNRLLVAAMMLLLPATGSHEQFVSGTADAQCTSPVFITWDTNGGWSDGGYYVHNNMWNSDAGLGPETLYACSYDNWYVVSNQTNNAGAVKTYPNVHKDYSNTLLSSFSYLTSTFAATSPHAGIYNVAYDIWLNGVATAGCVEVMIWTENFNQVPGGSKVDTYTQPNWSFDVWRADWSWTYLAFVPDEPVTSGSIDLRALFDWMISKTWLSEDATMDQLCFGVEIVSTDGTDATFTFTDFSINTTPAGQVIWQTGSASGTKSPTAVNEYYSLAGKRLDLSGSPVAGMKSRVAVNRMIEENGAVRSRVMLFAR
jgi:hypothetical protein